MTHKMKIIMLICSVIVGCDSTKSNISIKECTYERQVENLVQKIIDTRELQQYFDEQNTPKKDNLIVLINDELMKMTNIKRNSISVLFLSQSEILEKNIKSFLEFQRIEIIEQIATVKMVYKIEGIEYNAKYKLNNCQWELIEKQLYEN